MKIPLPTVSNELSGLRMAALRYFVCAIAVYKSVFSARLRNLFFFKCSSVFLKMMTTCVFRVALQAYTHMVAGIHVGVICRKGKL